MKKHLAILVINLAIFCACQGPVQKSQEASKALIEQYFKLFNQHEWKALAAMYADTAIFKDPTFGMKPIKKSRAQFVEEYTALSKTFPDVHDQVINIYPSGEHHVTVEFVSTGTGPDQKKFELPIVVIFRIEQGKIVEDFTYYDNF
ncbi:nuclear transport factor 2 family protein [Aquirufa rosea]|uniref:Nuclear transport factor 2 family protein n=1 Tax=Aquirufa rosea TaxID=2509241 RepID=A0A4Q1C0D2_9BACT|nr:nuclear transport factor 2 family protein [Aquirufa rosea]RXK49882.1 nuclear transport factor 2 family protein [Aquirufa rosea]